MIEPDPCSRITADDSFVPSQAPTRCTSITARKSSMDILRMTASRVIPALLTMTSRDPKRSALERTSTSMSASEVTSQVSDTASAPAPRSFAAEASAWSRLMSAITTRAPSSAKAVAMASPMPCAAPVTTAVFSSSRPTSLLG